MVMLMRFTRLFAHPEIMRIKIVTLKMADEVLEEPLKRTVVDRENSNLGKSDVETDEKDLAMGGSHGVHETEETVEDIGLASLVKSGVGLDRIGLKHGLVGDGLVHT